MLDNDLISDYNIFCPYSDLDNIVNEKYNNHYHGFISSLKK